MTNINWKTIEQSEHLDQIHQRSFELPQVIYKHSIRCSISSMVLNRLERSWESTQLPSLEAHFLDLINYRALSNTIAEQYGVYHESPQILIIMDGKAIFDTSHMGISFTAVKQALDQVSSTPI